MIEIYEWIDPNSPPAYDPLSFDMWVAADSQYGDYPFDSVDFAPVKQLYVLKDIFIAAEPIYEDEGSGTVVLDSFTQGFSQVQASPTPEPTTMLLFGPGLIALAGFRRKFRN